jgi:tRNA threonylcarbamoyladenosine biosynthesis protein TsaE
MRFVDREIGVGDACRTEAQVVPPARDSRCECAEIEVGGRSGLRVHNDRMGRIEAILADAQATERAGRAIARAIVPGMIITLSGDLGAGKTTLARGILHGLGWTGSVKSPSYALVEHYPFSNLYLYHFDFYRFEHSGEWDDAGFAEAFRRDSVCLVEWPERVAERLPGIDVAISLALPTGEDAGRRLRAVALKPAGERCLSALDAATGGRR